MYLTTYGYRQLDDGDAAKGANGWFESIEFDIARLDSHNHDGANSALITGSAITPFSNSILAAAWTVDGGGFKQTVNTPAGMAAVDIADYNLKFVFTAPGGQVGRVAYLSWDRISPTSFDVYCNDVTAAFTVLYR